MPTQECSSVKVIQNYRTFSDCNFSLVLEVQITHGSDTVKFTKCTTGKKKKTGTKNVTISMNESSLINGTLIWHYNSTMSPPSVSPGHKQQKQIFKLKNKQS